MKTVPCARPACTDQIFIPDHPGPGRPRKWCSDACRRRAFEERRAADAGAIAVRVVTVEPALDDHVAAVLSSPAACRRVLRQIGDWSATGVLLDAKWSSVADELARLRRPEAPRPPGRLR